jgi:hypothetical protein
VAQPAARGGGWGAADACLYPRDLLPEELDAEEGLVLLGLLGGLQGAGERVVGFTSMGMAEYSHRMRDPCMPRCRPECAGVQARGVNVK